MAEPIAAKEDEEAVKVFCSGPGIRRKRAIFTAMLPGSVHSLRFRRHWTHSAFVDSHPKNIEKPRTEPRREGKMDKLQRESKLHIPTKDPGTMLILQIFEDNEIISGYRLKVLMYMVNAVRLQDCFGGKYGSRLNYGRTFFRGTGIVNDRVALRTEQAFAGKDLTIKSINRCRGVQSRILKRKMFV